MFNKNYRKLKYIDINFINLFLKLKYLLKIFNLYVFIFNFNNKIII